MKSVHVGLLGFVVLSACAPIPAKQPMPAVRTVAFSCTNGETLSVQFFLNEEKAILTRNGSDIEMPQQPSASGIWYSNGPNTLRGKGDDLTVQIGRMVPLQCTAQHAKME